MPELLAIAYPSETEAARAAAELGRCAAEIPIDPDAIGVIICERDGNCRLLTSRRPGATAAWAKFWGVLFGMVVNESESGEIDPGFRRRALGLLAPATSMLLAMPNAAPRRVLDAVSQFGGEPLVCEIDGPVTVELRDALRA